MSRWSCSWAAPNANGSPITSYTLREYTDGAYARAITVKDPSTLSTSVAATKGHTYYFTLAATNALGRSAYSTASRKVLAAAKPAQVGAVKATAGNARVTLAWSAPAANGDAISSYVVTPSTGAARRFTTAGASFTGLVNGRAYTFRVSACNSVGCGPCQRRPGAVTPVKPVKPRQWPAQLPTLGLGRRHTVGSAPPPEPRSGPDWAARTELARARPGRADYRDLRSGKTATGWRTR